MARGIYLDEDISIFLNKQEIIDLGLLELDWDASDREKLSHKYLDVLLEKNGCKQLIVRVEVKDFDDLGDGIKVDRTDYGFLVYINNTAYWRMRDNNFSGTRYDGSNKIHFYREDDTN